jgi:hypothetical protein
MSQIKLSPNASGTGIFTIASPNSNTDRTLTLPDQTGTVLTNAGPFTANASASAGAVTIDASNNVGIGTSSPSYPLHIVGNVNGSVTAGVTNSSSGASGYARFLAIANAGSANFGMTSSGYTDITGAQDAMLFNANDASGGICFAQAGVVSAKLDSSGNLLVGATSQIGAVTARGVFSSAANLLALQAGNGNVGAYMTNNSGTGNWQPFSFCNNGSSFTQIGSITTTASATAYNTSSDYRLKEDIQPMQGALSRVSALKPVTYRWKVDGSGGEGFIAHELQEVCPDAVTGEKDAVNEDGSIKPQGIDTSFLVATLTAAIQELKAIVDAQAVEIAALKGAQE